MRRLPKILEQPGSDLERSDCLRGLRRLCRPRSWRYWSKGRAAGDGKQGAALFVEFAGIDAVPVVVDTHEIEDIAAIVRAIAPTYGGINLEDFPAPQCFAIEEQLQYIGSPVLRDDQPGTAIVLLAALLNAARCLGRSPDELSVVINGAGAAGRAIAHLLPSQEVSQQATAVQEVVICARHGKPHS